MTDNVITVGSEVTMHFTLKLTDNTVAQTTKEGAPSTFTMTKDSLKDPVESKLIGLKPGDKMRVELSPEQAYGLPNPDNIHVLPKTQFPADTLLNVGDIFQFDRPNGESVPGIVTLIDDERVTVDFNHPLSGKHLLVLAEIISVK